MSWHDLYQFPPYLGVYPPVNKHIFPSYTSNSAGFILKPYSLWNVSSSCLGMLSFCFNFGVDCCGSSIFSVDANEPIFSILAISNLFQCYHVRLKIQNPTDWSFITARSTTVQSAVFLPHVACPSVRLSVCLSVRLSVFWRWWIMTTLVENLGN